ncbi:MAG: tetratricopeptide repeat protein [Candidatus Eremiobacterota bacterium]
MLKYEHIVLIILLASLTFVTLYYIPAADTWLNLATGKYIIDEGTLPQKDVFSYTANGRPWNSTQWFILAVFYIFYSILGKSGIYLLRTAFILTTFAFIFSICRVRSLNPLISVICIIISAFIAQPYYYFDIRAYLVSYVFTAIYLFLLERRRIQGKAFPWWLLPLVNCIWVNSHSGFIMGLGLIFIYFLDELITEKDKKKSFYLMKIFFLTFISSFLNPYGYKLFLQSFIVGQSYGFMEKFLVEWNRPELAGQHLPFTIFWIITAFFIIITAKKSTLRDIMIWAIFSYMAFKAVRHITLFCIVIVPVFLKHLELLLKDRLNGTAAIENFINTRTYIKITFLIICFLIFFRTVFLISTEDFSLEKKMFPYYGVEFLRLNNLPGRLYNPYEWGGYIMWTMYPEKLVFCDGRATVVYTEEICRESYFSMTGHDLSVFDKYNINLVLCNKINEPLGMNLPSVLKNKPDEWCLIYSDENSYIFIRNNSSNKKIIDDFYSGNLVIPDTPLGNYYEGTVLLKNGNYEKALQFLDKSLELNENFIEALMTKGYILAITGNFKEGKDCFLKILSLDNDFPAVHYNLGLIYKNSGDFDDAEREFMIELKIHDYKPALEELEKLKKRRGK